MKNKKRILWIAICALVLCVAIVASIIIFANSEQGNNTPQNNTNDDLDNTDVETKITKVIPYNEESLDKDLEDAGLKEHKVVQTEKGVINQDGLKNNTENEISIYSKTEEGTDISSSTLVVETDKDVLMYKLDVDEYGSYDIDMELADVDGDGVDEVIVQQLVANTGGFGSYISQVLKINGDKVTCMFVSPDEKLFDTGFEGYLEDGLKVKITNNYVNLAETADLEKSKDYGMSVHSDGKSLVKTFSENKFNREYYDEKGNVITDSFKKDNNYLGVDTFYDFYPEDVDGDGVFEVVGLQHTSLQSRNDFVGSAKTVLKYNPKSGEFEVFQADFIPAELVDKKNPADE